VVYVSLQVGEIVYFTAAAAMSFALHKYYPHLHGWGNVSRSLGWPVTLYEIKKGMLDDD
jgi:hypothetical protein